MYFGFLRSSFFRLVYQIIQTARDLHSRDRGDNRHDDGNDIEWNCPWLHADGGKYQNTQPTSESNTDAPSLAPKKIASKTMISSTTIILAFLVV
ncbi:Uncharacterised protein [Salmonella enterica subsp. enterica]|nr:Uncharacterised protein [Salmonella enterica subsp. enterica]